MSIIIRLDVPQNLDQTGEPEEFTFDLFPFCNNTSHLDKDGLPKIDTYIKPGMVIVGKNGKTNKFNPHKIHSCLETLTSTKKLRNMYRNMLYDSSVYATSKTCGIVKKAYLEHTTNNLLNAVVEIELDK